MVSPVGEVLAAGKSRQVLIHSPKMHQAFMLIGFSLTWTCITRTCPHMLQLAVSTQLGPDSQTLAIVLRNFNRGNDAPRRDRVQGPARNLFLPGSGSRDGGRSKTLLHSVSLHWPGELVESVEDKRLNVH